MNIKKVKNWFSNKVMTTFAFLFATPAFADGFAATNDLMDKISIGLHGLAVVTVTVAFFIVGYSVMFNGNTVRECSKTIIGAGIIAGGAEIAALLVG